MAEGGRVPEGVNLERLRDKLFQQEQTDSKRAEGSTKDTSFENTASGFGIPQEYWDHPRVREYVGYFNQIQQLQLDFSISERSRLGQEKSELASELGRVPQLEDVSPPIWQRYRKMDYLMTAAVFLLREGFNGRAIKDDPSSRSYLRTRIQASIGGTGLDVFDTAGLTQADKARVQEQIEALRMMRESKPGK